jgi:hypothetical protein
VSETFILIILCLRFALKNIFSFRRAEKRKEKNLREELETRERRDSNGSNESISQMNSVNPRIRVFLTSESEDARPRANSNRSTKSNSSYAREPRQQTESDLHTIPLKEIKKNKNSKTHDAIDRSQTLKELKENWNFNLERGQLDQEFQKVNYF